jgi:O-antigen/teichoic acid export membrane protein
MWEVRRGLRLGVFATLVQFTVLFPLLWRLRHNMVVLFNVPVCMAGTAATVLPVMGGLAILGCINECLGMLIAGCQRAGFVTIVQTAGQVLNYAVSTVGLSLGLGLSSMLVGYIAMFLVNGLWLYAVARRLCGGLSLLPAVPTFREMREVRGYFAFTVVGSVSIALRDQTDKLVLSAFASPAWAGHYGIAVRLAALLLMMAQFFYVPTIAAVGASNASGDWDAIQRLYATMMSVVAVAVGTMLVLVGGLYDRLMVVWLGQFVPGAVPMLLLLIAGNAVAASLTGTGSALCKGIGRPAIETTYVVINLVLNLVLTIALVAWLGAIGTVISSSATWFAGALVFTLVLHRALDLPRAATARAAGMLLLALGPVLLLRYVGDQFALEGGRLDATLSAAWMGALGVSAYGALLFCSRLLSPSALRGLWRMVRR